MRVFLGGGDEESLRYDAPNRRRLCRLILVRPPMTVPLLTTAANGHSFLTFETYGPPQWHMALEWLKRESFVESGVPVFGLDEGILPSFVRHGVTIAAGFDNWSGNYLLAECDEGDQIILGLANYVSAVDRRSVA